MVFQLDFNFIRLLDLISQSLKYCAAFLLFGLCLWTPIGAMLDIVARAKQMHQIPCTKCRFFTTDYRLKCTVQPHIANTEQAIDCSDYQCDRQ